MAAGHVIIIRKQFQLMLVPSACLSMIGDVTTSSLLIGQLLEMTVCVRVPDSATYEQ